MEKYLTKFDTHADYLAAKDELRLPNVSYCVQENEIHYNPYVDYRTKYLTLETVVERQQNPQEFTFVWQTYDSSHPVFPEGHLPQYSLDNGVTWTDFQNGVGVSCSVDGKMLIKAEMNEYYDYGNSSWSYDDYPAPPFQIRGTTAYKVSGNLLSLAYGDDFANHDEITNTSLGFFLLFGNDYISYSTLIGQVYDASDLYLNFSWPNNYDMGYNQPYGGFSYMFYKSNLVYAPKQISKNLVPYCCYHMFAGCSDLQTTPELPIMTLTNYCYRAMFYNCTSLTTAPELPATTLAEACYRGMFKGCSELTTSPSILPAMTLANECYYEMFYQTKISEAPELPATTLADRCYYYMFYRCTNITTAPTLPAEILTIGCYYGMFYYCTGLTTVPELNATTLTQDCYRWMFGYCSNIETAPVLPATTLVSNCYTGMFGKCTHLNYIKAMFTTTPSNTYTQNWVQNVAASGNFVKNSSAQWNVSGVNGIPLGWTVETANS